MELRITLNAAEAAKVMASGSLEALIHDLAAAEADLKDFGEKMAEAVETKKELTKQKQKAASAGAPAPSQPAELRPAAPEKSVAEEQKTFVPQPARGYTLDQLCKAAADLLTRDAEKQTDLLGLLNARKIESMQQLKEEQFQGFAEDLRKIGADI